MHSSHDFFATKTCPMHEFLEVLGQVRVWNRKSAGRARVGMVCGGRVWVRSGQDFSNSFGCGAGL